MENVPGALRAFILVSLFLSLILGATAVRERQASLPQDPPAAQREESVNERPKDPSNTRREASPDSPPTRESAEIPSSEKSPEPVALQEPSEAQSPQPREQRDGTGEESSDTNSQERPNILFVLTDDQTARSISKMPKLKSLVVDKGTKFNNSFVTTPRCCPSRATFLRGQYAHNSRIMGNELPLGGFQKFRRLGQDKSTVATWLDDVGYKTFYLGKYLNNYDNTTYAPPGWDRWFGWLGHYYSPDKYQLNENGRIVTYERSRKHDTDLFRDKAVRFVENQAEGEDPFFMYVAPNAPHKPAYVADRHDGMFSEAPLPPTPSFNERDVSDKPALVRNKSSISTAKEAKLESLHQRQLASLQSVDDMVGDLVKTLRATGQLENTYIIFSSDNGFFYGEHRLEDKSLAYEEATKIPFVVRGPGVPTQKLDHLVVNNDFAPTVADLAGVDPPDFVDGKSFEPLLKSPVPDAQDWRKRFLIELWRTDYKALRTPKYKYVEHSACSRRWAT